MTTLELTLSVDELSDYNEMGAKPTEPNYDLIIIAEVEIHARTIQSISVYDSAYMISINFDILTAKDQEVINSRILDFITNNIDFLMDSLKEQKQDNDIQSYKDGRLK